MTRSAESSGQGPHYRLGYSSNEIDDYMRRSLKATPRTGLHSVTVKIFPYNYISTFTIVDFDAVEKWKAGTIPGIPARS